MIPKSGLIAFLGLVFWVSFATPGACQPAPQPAMDTAITGAAGALQRLAQTDGSFLYQASLDGTPINKPYNMVRHAGVLYALEMYDSRAASAAVEATIGKGVAFIGRNTRMVTDASQPPMLAVWAQASGKQTTDLGATALSVVALAGSRASSGGEEEARQLTALGRFLLYMQKPDGSFYSQYDFAKQARDDQFASLYYPGEAALALVRLYEGDKTAQRQGWANGAKRGLLALARLRREQQKYEPDNWALGATAALFRSDIALSDEERAALETHLEGTVAADLVFQESGDGVMAGALTPTGSPTQTSTRIEGLLAALPYIQDKALASRAREALAKAMLFLRRSQIEGGPMAGGFPDQVRPDPAHPHPPYMRMDFTQHALSAMLLYREAGLR